MKLRHAGRTLTLAIDLDEIRECASDKAGDASQTATDDDLLNAAVRTTNDHVIAVVVNAVHRVHTDQNQAVANGVLHAQQRKRAFSELISYRDQARGLAAAENSTNENARSIQIPADLYRSNRRCGKRAAHVSCSRHALHKAGEIAHPCGLDGACRNGTSRSADVPPVRHEVAI